MNDEVEKEFIHTQETFKALVDAIIPRSPALAEEYGKIQYYGALDEGIDTYIIMTLNNLYIPLADSTADMLDVAARQLVLMEGNTRLFNYSRYPGGGLFAALSPNDRFRAMMLLSQMNVNFSELPVMEQNNPDLILNIINVLNRYTLMGYYSEWSGYGSTRMENPNDRTLEYAPLSWEQVNYPGPSLGYRALRRER
jgi:hypothetical protein